LPRASSLREVPALLDELVFEMMSKAPLDRPSSIEQVAQTLRHLGDSRTALQKSSRRSLTRD
jgi:hypothetical protein